MILALLFAIDRWRHKRTVTDAQLVSMLPAENSMLFFADLATLRHEGLIRILAGVKPAEDKDYQQFVRQTQFDYTRDVDALAGSGSAREIFFVARGRFDWEKLRRYAEARGGSCGGARCQMQASTPGRWVALRLFAPDLVALAVGENRDALKGVRWSVASTAMPASGSLWIRFAPAVFRNVSSLPAGLRVFAATLQQANSVLISAGAPDASMGGRFAIRLDAGFSSEAAAQGVRKQLQLNTNMLTLALLREHTHAMPNSTLRRFTLASPIPRSGP